MSKEQRTRVRTGFPVLYHSLQRLPSLTYCSSNTFHVNYFVKALDGIQFDSQMVEYVHKKSDLPIERTKNWTHLCFCTDRHPPIFPWHAKYLAVNNRNGTFARSLWYLWAQVVHKTRLYVPTPMANGSNTDQHASDPSCLNCFYTQHTRVAVHGLFAILLK
jgi:hypothetical protein